MFGGVGTVWGPVIGATILIPLSEILHAEFGAHFPGIQGVIFGIAIVDRHSGGARRTVLERRRNSSGALAGPGGRNAQAR